MQIQKNLLLLVIDLRERLDRKLGDYRGSGAGRVRKRRGRQWDNSLKDSTESLALSNLEVSVCKAEV